MERRGFGMEAVMSTVVWDPMAWAEREFGECQLGDRRRVERLKKVAAQVAVRPDGSTPDQFEIWSDLKATYRLFNCGDVSFQGILEPHCRHTREDCRPGDVMLILNDTTELDYTTHRKTRGLGVIGNGGGRGFFVHSGLMVNAVSGRIEGMAGQEIFYRQARKGKRPPNNTKRRSEKRESAVWGRLIDRIGPPPPEVRWIHVCDRGADDFEVMCKALHNNCGFVIRASRLQRKVLTPDGRPLKLAERMDELPACGTREIHVPAHAKRPSRTAVVELRYGEVFIPRPSVLTPWLKQHAPQEPLPLQVVELREMTPPKGEQPIRWVLYSTESATSSAEANQIIEHYEKRPTIEDYHKCFKTGCRVECRQYQEAASLERVAALLSVCAVRLLQLKTAARETPNLPARKVVPEEWITTLQRVRKRPANLNVTVHEFVRELAGLGGHLLRKCDGEPGWITVWRGHEKLQQILRGVHAAQRRCR